MEMCSLSALSTYQEAFLLRKSKVKCNLVRTYVPTQVLICSMVDHGDHDLDIVIGPKLGRNACVLVVWSQLMSLHNCHVELTLWGLISYADK